MDRRRFAYIGVALAVLLAGWLIRSSGPARPSGTVSPAPVEGANDAVHDDEVLRVPLRQPPAALAELGVLTDRSEAALARMLDREALAALLVPELCGDEEACAAVRRTLKDEHATTLRVGIAAEWAADRADFDASASSLAPVDRAHLAKRDHAVIVRVAAVASPLQLPIRTAFAIAAAIAGAIDGLVDDPVLGRIENAHDFSKHAVTESLRASAFRLDRIQVLYEPKGEGAVRLLTAGLERFGAPDVEAAAVPLGASERAAQLLVAVAATIADGARVAPIALSGSDFGGIVAQRTEDARSPATTVNVITVHPEAGDPNDFMVRIEPPDGDEPMGYLELLENLFFGPVLDVAPDDATRTIQHDRAQRALGPALARWNATRGAGAHLLVRLPFAIPGDAGVESMWVDVKGYDARALTGLIVDDPLAATDVARGDRVTRARTEVEDVRLK